MKVRDLVPGMTFHLPMGGTAVFVQQAPHPLYHGLRLVLWRIYEHPLDPGLEWSPDALSGEQDLGEPDWVADPPETALRKALLHPSQLSEADR